MNKSNALSSRLSNASVLLRSGTVKSLHVVTKESGNYKVQSSWGSAMRR